MAEKKGLRRSAIPPLLDGIVQNGSAFRVQFRRPTIEKNDKRSGLTGQRRLTAYRRARGYHQGQQREDFGTGRHSAIIA